MPLGSGTGQLSFSFCDTILLWFFMLLDEKCPCHTAFEVENTLFRQGFVYFGSCSSNRELGTFPLFSRRWCYSKAFYVSLQSSPLRLGVHALKKEVKVRGSVFQHVRLWVCPQPSRWVQGVGGAPESHGRASCLLGWTAGQFPSAPCPRSFPSPQSLCFLFGDSNLFPSFSSHGQVEPHSLPSDPPRPLPARSCRLAAGPPLPSLGPPLPLLCCLLRDSNLPTSGCIDGWITLMSRDALQRPPFFSPQ